MSTADYVELVPPHGHNPGCVRLMRQAGVLAAMNWNPNNNFPVTVYCLYGAGVWYVEVDYAEAPLLIGPLSLQSFEPAIGLGSARRPFAGGMELYSATIGHAAEEGYLYCWKEAVGCQIYPYDILLGHDPAASVDGCLLQTISGSWTWALDSGAYLPVTTSANPYLQVRIPHPSTSAVDGAVCVLGSRKRSAATLLLRTSTAWPTNSLGATATAMFSRDCLTRPRSAQTLQEECLPSIS